jgi:hypothetical protein
MTEYSDATIAAPLFSPFVSTTHLHTLDTQSRTLDAASAQAHGHRQPVEPPVRVAQLLLQGGAVGRLRLAAAAAVWTWLAAHRRPPCVQGPPWVPRPLGLQAVRQEYQRGDEQQAVQAASGPVTRQPRKVDTASTHEQGDRGWR